MNEEIKKNLLSFWTGQNLLTFVIFPLLPAKQDKWCAGSKVYVWNVFDPWPPTLRWTSPLNKGVECDGDWILIKINILLGTFVRTLQTKRKSYYKVCPLVDISYAAVFSGKRLVYSYYAPIYSLFFSICSPSDVEYAGFEHNILDTIGTCFIIIKYIV
jgi:hypothetical protein